ncbi:MAG: PilT/PilU family type 4a pilus ATPase [Armatimonadetes bacterium]|nr:PilT/PilU family type 4a pilus ATPase [Armatimonadota bacterium]
MITRQPASILTLEDAMRIGVEENATDMHLVVGIPPMYRIGTSLKQLRCAPLTPGDTKRLAYEGMADHHIKDFDDNLRTELTTSFSGYQDRRFRYTVSMQKGHFSIDIRLLPTHVRSIEELGLPEEVAEMARRRRGLILITGRGGQGKTTTLAAMIDLINRERMANIILIEDPIEYFHICKKSIVQQREVGTDTATYATGLKVAMKQNADVIVLGEVIDQESLETAIWAAETGHLIIVTMHTYDIGESVDRIVSAFPIHEQQRIMSGLSTSLQGVISQQLVPRLEPDPILGGRIAALEVIPTNTHAIKRLIREGRLYARDPYIKTASAQGLPVLTMDDHLAILYQEGKIDHDTMMMHGKEKPL